MFKVKVELPSLGTVTIPLKISHSHVATPHAITESEHTPQWLATKLSTPVPRPLKDVIAEGAASGIDVSGADEFSAEMAESVFAPSAPS
jgi:hypothetical protein